jgi:hypothetical protein
MTQRGSDAVREAHVVAFYGHRTDGDHGLGKHLALAEDRSLHGEANVSSIGFGERERPHFVGDRQIDGTHAREATT